MENNRYSIIKEAALYAFPKTIPILMGFLFLGISYGIYMYSMGFHWGYALSMSALIFAGSMEFVATAMLLGPFAPLSALLITLMVNARHLFYGLSMLERYKNMGNIKPYLIFGMCDESFSINYISQIPDHISKKWYYFFVTLYNQLYWVVGAVLGNIFGTILSFNTKGLEFVLTALFIVLAMEQWKAQRNTISSLLGIVIPMGAIYVWGSDVFMIPSMIGIIVLLSVLRSSMEGKV